MRSSTSSGNKTSTSKNLSLSDYENPYIVILHADSDSKAYVTITDIKGTSKSYSFIGNLNLPEINETITLYDADEAPYDVNVVKKANSLYCTFTNVPPDATVQAYAESSSGSSAKRATTGAVII